MGVLTVDRLQRAMKCGIVALDVILDQGLGHLEVGVVSRSSHLEGWMYVRVYVQLCLRLQLCMYSQLCVQAT